MKGRPSEEAVIRNSLLIDEGDPLNNILLGKSLNNLKARGIFKNVESKVNNGSSENKKIVKIDVTEKATGEISAGAGAGTSGQTVSFGVRENNYLGKGITLETNLWLSEETIKESIFLVLASLAYEAIMSSASYPSNSNWGILNASTHSLIIPNWGIIL